MPSQSHDVLKHIKKTLEKLDNNSSQKLPKHFWFAQKLLKLWDKLKKPNLANPAPLMPQQSEALMAWDRLSNLFDKEILEHFALIRAFNLFNTVRIIEGSDSSHSQVISSADAMVSKQKNDAFEITFNIRMLLNRFWTVTLLCQTLIQ